MALALAIYGGWILLTLYWRVIPLWVFIPLAAWVTSWQGSLQHEVLHGHPTRHRAINDALGWPPLALWLPYPIYRLSHLTHHRDERLTDPIDDPESFYVTEAAWEKLPHAVRVLLAFNQTLLGRLLVGPAFMIGFFLADEFRRVWGDEKGRRLIWVQQVLFAAVILVWVCGFCGMPFWLYFVAFVYCGGSLLRIRSYAEHRFAEKHEERTAIVEHGGLLGLLFLNNNLHVLHHLRPATAWYRLPRLYRVHREELLARNGGLVYRGYFDVFRRFFLQAHDDVLHPKYRRHDTP